VSSPACARFATCAGGLGASCAKHEQNDVNKKNNDVNNNNNEVNNNNNKVINNTNNTNSTNKQIKQTKINKPIKINKTNKGKKWDLEEENRLCKEFNSEISISEIAKNHQRTEYAIKKRLQKLGKLA